MYKSNNNIIYSASDLVGFLECEHATTLDLVDLETPIARAKHDDESALLHDKGLAHEHRFVEQLSKQHASFVDLSAIKGVPARLDATLLAMQQGTTIIYQAALRSDALVGYPDFLRRVERPSSLGSYSYEVIDTKLARSAKSKFIVQLAAYSECLAEAQGVAPLMMHVVLGNLSELNYRYQDYSRYVRQLRRRFEERRRARDVSRSMRLLRPLQVARGLRRETGRGRSPVPGGKHL
jgi:uncharacterized protein